jgi:hypothetical protein
LCREGDQESEAEEELDQGTQQQRRHLTFDRLRFGLVGWLAGWLLCLLAFPLLNSVGPFLQFDGNWIFDLANYYCCHGWPPFIDRL